LNEVVPFADRQFAEQISLAQGKGAVLTEPNLYTIEAVCLNLRESDEVEIFNVMQLASKMHLAHHCYQAVMNNGRGRVAWYNGRPTAVIALTTLWTGVWEIWMFGTNDFRNVAFDLVRWARREAREILDHAEGHRIQCDCRVGHPDAHKLLQAFGARPEGPPMKQFGKDRADYQRYVWLRDEDWDVLEPHYKRQDK
jgi:hypothetical protein